MVVRTGFGVVGTVDGEGIADMDDGVVEDIPVVIEGRYGNCNVGLIRGFQHRISH